MKTWINISSWRRITFKCIDELKNNLGHIVIKPSGTAWYTQNSCGTAKTVGQAKRAVEVLAEVES